MSRAARFEIVRTATGWHARFRAGNGQVVWVTESYRKRETARNAIDSIVRALSPTDQCWVQEGRGIPAGQAAVGLGYRWPSSGWGDAWKVSIQTVDER